MAIFHGQELATNIIESNKFDWELKDSKLYFMLEQRIHFDVSIKNIHRCAKLCFTLNYITKRKKEVFTIGLLSLNMFDYQGYLINGLKNLYMWPTSSKESFCNLFNSEVSGILKEREDN